MSAKDGYLVLYNSLCCFGWAVILYLSLPHVLSACCLPSLQEALRSLYLIPGLAQTLTVVQLAAVLEIFHAAAGIVRSPIFVTAVQVASRLAALFFVTFSPPAQGWLVACLLACLPTFNVSTRNNLLTISHLKLVPHIHRTNGRGYYDPLLGPGRSA